MTEEQTFEIEVTFAPKSTLLQTWTKNASLQEKVLARLAEIKNWKTIKNPTFDPSTLLETNKVVIGCLPASIRSVIEDRAKISEMSYQHYVSDLVTRYIESIAKEMNLL